MININNRENKRKAEKKCPNCGSINIRKHTGRNKPTNKEMGFGKIYPYKTFYCRKCGYKF